MNLLNKGFVVFSQPKRLAAVKKLNARAHWEICQGSSEQCRAYCTKDDTRQEGPWESGTFPSEAGKRTDLIEFAQAVTQDPSLYSLIDSHPHMLVKYPRGTQFLSQLCQERSSPEWRQMNVVVYWGPTGVGKTRLVHELANGELYKVQNYPWFDGYRGQQNVLFDEFYGQIPANVLLNLLDGYSQQLGIKGAFTYARWTTVYITSNCAPTSWYKKKVENQGNLPLMTTSIPQPVRDAIARRINKIYLLTHEATFIQPVEV